MRIAVISDTHGYYPPQLPALIADADEIWHLGDVCEPAVLDAFQKPGRPLHVVLGNNDAHHWPRTILREIDGLHCLLVHIPPFHMPHGGCDILLHGHTHIPCDEMIHGIRWLNPGAITFPRSGAPSSFAWLTFNGPGREPGWKIVPL